MQGQFWLQTTFCHRRVVWRSEHAVGAKYVLGDAAKKAANKTAAPSAAND